MDDQAATLEDLLEWRASLTEPRSVTVTGADTSLASVAASITPNPAPSTPPTDRPPGAAESLEDLPPDVPIGFSEANPGNKIKFLNKGIPYSTLKRWTELEAGEGTLTASQLAARYGLIQQGGSNRARFWLPNR